MKALILGERVVQIADDAFPVAPPLFWVEAPPGTTTDHRYVVGALIAPEGLAAAEQDYTDAIQAHIDAVAQSRSYRHGDALASYAGSSVPTWAAEAAAFVAWRDAVWLYAYTQLAAVQAHERAQPTVEGLIAELPEIAWPE